MGPRAVMLCQFNTVNSSSDSYARNAATKNAPQREDVSSCNIHPAKEHFLIVIMAAPFGLSVRKGDDGGPNRRRRFLISDRQRIKYFGIGGTYFSAPNLCQIENSRLIKGIQFVAMHLGLVTFQRGTFCFDIRLIQNDI